VLAPALVGPTVAQAEWPQWRGAARDGSVSRPASRRPGLAAPIKLWERTVGGGYSGPVVADDLIWVHSRSRAQEVVTCLTLGEGEPVWSARYDADFEQDPTALVHGSGPYSTPSIVDGRLFTFGVSAVLSVWDAATGTLLWRTDYSEESLPDFPFFGAAASPLIWNDLCFVHLGGTEGRRGGAPGRGAMVALRVTDGKEQWRWTGDGPALAASPVLSLIDQQWQLVFKTQERIVGLDPHAGRELWRIPYKVTEDNTIVSPLVLGDQLVTSDPQMGVTAWRIQSNGKAWELRQIWHSSTVSLSFSSPVVMGDQVVGFSHYRKGQLFGLDSANGDVLWRGDPRWGEHASLIKWGDDLLALRGDGLLVAGKVTQDGFRTEFTHRLGQEMTWGHPAIVDDRIIIRDGDRLAVYRLRSAE
jgi:outer membrane protein assembly factor BamB